MSTTSTNSVGTGLTTEVIRVRSKSQSFNTRNRMGQLRRIDEDDDNSSVEDGSPVVDIACNGNGVGGCGVIPAAIASSAVISHAGTDDSEAAQKILNGRGVCGRNNLQEHEEESRQDDNDDYYYDDDDDTMELASPTSSTSRTKNTASMALLQQHQPTSTARDMLEVKRLHAEQETQKRKELGGFDGTTTTNGGGGGGTGDNSTITTRNQPQWLFHQRRKRVKWISLFLIFSLLLIMSSILWKVGLTKNKTFSARSSSSKGGGSDNVGTVGDDKTRPSGDKTLYSDPSSSNGKDGSFEFSFSEDSTSGGFSNDEPEDAVVVEPTTTTIVSSPSAGDETSMVSPPVSNNNNVGGRITFAYKCSDAQDLVVNDLSFGSTRKAPVGVSFPVCGPQVAMNGRGVWYKLLGNNEVWTIDTCSGADFDTQISVYEGSCDDDENEGNDTGSTNNLVCVASNDQYCDDLAGVTFFAKSNVQYYVYIHGWRDESGEFSYFATSASLLQQELEMDDNLSCETAEFVELSRRDSLQEIIDTTRNLPVQPSKSASEARYHSSTSASSTSLAMDVPAKWYRITGWGNRVTVSTCSDQTNYAAKMRVLHGNGPCDELLPISEDSQDKENCPNQFGSIVSFDTIPGELYYIMILGRQQEEVVESNNKGGIRVPQSSSSTIGDDIRAEYGFIISDSFFKNQYLSNPIDNCYNHAEYLEPNDGIEIGVLHQVPDIVVSNSNTFVGTCGTSDYDNSAGDWYVVFGTGQTFTASTCNKGYTSFDTQITVFLGSSCDELFCVDGNDDSDTESCGEDVDGTVGASEITWDTIYDVTYYILVHGKGTRVGSYGLTLRTTK